MDFTPTCRYGHGALVKESPARAAGDAVHEWAFMGIATGFATTESSCEDALSKTEASGRVYAVRLYRCQKCGYLEMFDPEVGNG